MCQMVSGQRNAATICNLRLDRIVASSCVYRSALLLRPSQPISNLVPTRSDVVRGIEAKFSQSCISCSEDTSGTTTDQCRSSSPGGMSSLGIYSGGWETIGFGGKDQQIVNRVTLKQSIVMGSTTVCQNHKSQYISLANCRIF